ncbi:MAG TPA: hypothetical protein VFA69_04740 [Candidatus Nitrosotalea sp.]|nr:hypothetical protein [Candidatus Nitrosotalea sp.]
MAKLSFVVVLTILLFSIFANFNSSYAQLMPTSSQGYTKLVDTSTPTYQLYKNTQYGFSVEYPKTWNVVEHLDQKYVAKTIVISPDDNLQFHVGVIKNQNPYVGLTSQEILGQITGTLRNGCSGATLQSRGFTCTEPQFNANVTNYRGVPMYEVAMSWTKTLPTGASMKWISIWGFMPSSNDVWLLIVESSVNEFVGNMEASKHIFDSLDISSIPQNNPVPSQGTAKTIPHWIKNTAMLWSQGSVTDSDFIQGIQYLVQQGIIIVPATQVSSQPSQTIPSWVKNTVKWWSEGQVTDADFINGIQYLVQKGIISTQTVGQGQTAVTDQQGLVTFQINGQNVQFSFVDDTTGQPLSGVNVAFSLDQKTQSVGTLLIIDPNKHYPLQFVVLMGSASNSNTPTSWQNYLIPNASAEINTKVVVSVASDPRTIGSLLLVGALGPLGAHAGDTASIIYDSLALVTKYADKKGWLPASSYLGNQGFATETTTFDKVKGEIQDESIKGKTRDTIFLAGSIGTTTPGYLVSRAIDKVTTEMDMSTVSGCDPQTQEIKSVEIGFTKIYSCTSNKVFGLVKYDPPSESGHVSLDLLSKANQGFGERIQAEKGQTIPVPSDDYSMRVSSPGTNPITEDLTVTPDHTTDVTAVPQPISNNNQPTLGTTITPAGDLTGTWGGSFSMKDTTSDGCSFSGTWEATLTQDGNDLSGSLSIIQASSPDYPANDFCTLAPGTFSFEGGTVSSSSFQFDSSDYGGFHAKGYYTTDLIHGTFNECYDESCASGSFTGSRR